MTAAKPYLYAALAVLLCALVFGVYYFRNAYGDEQKATDKLKQEVAGQTAVISRQAFEFNRFNQITLQASQYAFVIKVKSDERQANIRKVVKKDPASRQCVPNTGGVVDRLLDHTNSLRASAMHADSSKSDTTNTGTAATTCRLTYAQAVYWIDPLLTVIDEANNRFTGIREAESSRVPQAQGDIAQ